METKNQKYNSSSSYHQNVDHRPNNESSADFLTISTIKNYNLKLKMLSSWDIYKISYYTS